VNCSLYHFSHPFPRFNYAFATASQLIPIPLVKTENQIALLCELGIARNAPAGSTFFVSPSSKELAQGGKIALAMFLFLTF
jgi:hypothetical protein